MTTTQNPAGTFTPTLGAVVGDHGVTFRIWAPAQAELGLVLDDRDIPMERRDDGYFSVEVAKARAGQRYWYRLSQGLRPDPASRYQPEGPLGPSEIVDPRAYQWASDHWPGAPAPHEHVIYEMHVGTFTPEGTWGAAERQLPELAEIGVTTLEVMPIAEFSGRFGWGYDGVDLFAPTRLYGTPNDVRHFIDTAHRFGLAVILDVVYNHFGPVGNYLRDFAPTFFGQPGEWGDTINYDGHGSGQVRAFAIENAAYWIAEYRLDGLRFDATQGINDSTPEHVVSEMAAAARAAAGGRRLFLVGESEPQDSRLLRHSRTFKDGLDALWNEDFHHAAYVALTGRRLAYFTDYQGTASEFASMARHGFLYQGQWYSWQTNPRGGFSMGLPSSSFVCFLENHDQVANTGLGSRLYAYTDQAAWRALTALLLTGPNLPMLFQGQEYGSSRPFRYFADHDGDLGEAVRRGRLEFLAQFPGFATSRMREVIAHPADEASYLECKLDRDRAASGNPSARHLHRDLLHLRRHDAVLSRVGTPAVTVESSAPTANVGLVRYMSTAGHRLLVVNLGQDVLSAMNDPLVAPVPGTRWELLWSSENASYGGSGEVPFVEAGRWLIRGKSTTILASSALVGTIPF